MIKILAACGAGLEDTEAIYHFLEEHFYIEVSA